MLDQVCSQRSSHVVGLTVAVTIGGEVFDIIAVLQQVDVLHDWMVRLVRVGQSVHEKEPR